MSGHSHARTVKHQKDITDHKRGQIFSKMARLISIVAKKGGNPETNSALRMALEEAKRFNMPKENIERAIKKSTGEETEEKLEEVIYEAYGPSGIAIIIEGITDNKNRSLSEIKQILNQYNGKLVGEGAVKWMFERKGCLTLDWKNQLEELRNKEVLELMTVEAGAQDTYWHDDELDIYTDVGDLETVKKNLEEKNIKVEATTLDWKPKEMVVLEEKEKETCQKLFEALDESDTVQGVYSNLKI